MSTKLSMCLGFMFSPDHKHVALILKESPDWQKGRMNGIGGKCEPGEGSRAAMAREFFEETGVNTDWVDWEHKITLEGERWEMDVYMCASEKVHDCRTVTKERVFVLPVAEALCAAHLGRTLSNLKWLIPFVLDNSEANGSPIGGTVYY